MAPLKVDPWVRKVESACERFAAMHSLIYNKTEREISASFEIGCFHSLVEFYERTCVVTPENLTKDNEYRYLTTPSGNPANFSHVKIVHFAGTFTLRQQVRIRSHLDPDIAFTPDTVVLRESAIIDSAKDRDYAKGKRKFFTVSSSAVVAAHECKSMNPFPELLVSFIGHVIAAHEWLDWPDVGRFLSKDGVHLAPTLFVGGTARALHIRMITALEKCYPLNILVGMHAGNWKLINAPTKLQRLIVNIEPIGKGSLAVAIEE
jgi:hypothetical protein